MAKYSNEYLEGYRKGYLDCVEKLIELWSDSATKHLGFLEKTMKDFGIDDAEDLKELN